MSPSILEMIGSGSLFQLIKIPCAYKFKIIFHETCRPIIDNKIIIGGTVLQR